jgi:uncharacterized protein (TIGR00251 family)
MTDRKEYITQTPEGIEFSIRLTPRGHANKIHGWQKISENQMALKVSVTAIPENGKANKALVKLLAKTFKMPQQAVKIIVGENARTKVLFIETNDLGLVEKIFKINALVAD